MKTTVTGCRKIRSDRSDQETYRLDTLSSLRKHPFFSIIIIIIKHEKEMARLRGGEYLCTLRYYYLFAYVSEGDGKRQD